MTNRDKLFMELYRLSNEQLYTALSDNRLTAMIEDIRCAECEEKHRGCPCPEDDKCLMTVEDWLGQPCSYRGPMITEEVLTR